MNVRAALAATAGLLIASSAWGSPANAQTCSRAVVFTLPGVTWAEVEREQPPELLAVIGRGAAGSVSVRTNSARTTEASGFATIGAGTRLDVPAGAPQPYGAPSEGVATFEVPGIDAIDELAEAQAYRLAVPGALGEAVARSGATRAGGVVAVGNQDPGLPPPLPFGYARYPVLAAMDSGGSVRAAVGADLLRADPASPYGVSTDEAAFSSVLDRVLADRCAVAVVDQGDLSRADRARAAAPSDAELREGRSDALAAADRALGLVAERLDPSDLLLVVSPTSPGWEPEAHFGVAVAVGPSFEAGGELISPSTRRPGIVTLPDVAPTVLNHLGLARPGSMLGRAWYSQAARADDVIASAAELDRETVFIDLVRTPVSTAFVLFQLLVYGVAIWVLVRRRERAAGTVVERALQSAALFLAAFPLSTYLAGLWDGHVMGAAAYCALLVAMTAAIVVTVNRAFALPLTRLLVVVGLTLGVLVVDLLVGAPLQLNTVFSYSPIVAGRFAGIGNIGFAILAATSLLTGALIVHRWGATRRSLAAVAALFALTVVVDGAPQFGSDVGGAIALVPGLAISWMLLAGRRPSWRSALVVVVGGAAVLALFLAVDLARPEESQTHLARLFEDVRSGGGEVFADAITRKVRTNLRVLGSTIWTFVVPPALALLAWLLLRPRWSWLSNTYPKVRAGLLGGLVMAVLGYAVNDSGIVIPAMMFSYLIPVAVAPLAEARLDGTGARG